jgi:D-alanyl-lipoteichoic acid acyltransferase DltB (MBOAT superfamily)
VKGGYDLGRYLLFVTFFPHLLAGPILHHREMMPQFARGIRWASYGRQVTFGVLLFAIGLFKKVFIADQIAPYANAAFAAVDAGQTLSLAAAWWGALAYTFQLYFDFSGYSDMAIGAALLFGIRLPINFNAPYAATSIIDFWRRWHMTLSRFLRDYLYIALGGNRLGKARRHLNLLLTMTLGGIWHGAGYGFLVWGLLHGGYLVINHGWRAVRGRVSLPVSGVERGLGWALTFLAVVVGWVFFRATTLSGALSMLSSMAGLQGGGLADVAEPFALMARHLPTVPLASLIAGALDLERLHLPVHPVLGSVGGLAWLPVALALAALGPTAQQHVAWLVRAARGSEGRRRAVALLLVAGVALLFMISAARLNNVTEFLYFQF